MKNYARITAILLVLLLSFLFGYTRGKHNVIRHQAQQKVDTITVYKTRYIDSPIEKHSSVVGRIAVPNYKFIAETVHDTTETTLLVYKTDTLYLPREQKYYEEAEGHARIWISGYEPSLDRFEWDEKIQTLPHDVPKQKQWNVSLSVGIGTNGSTFCPFVGVTAGRTIFRF